MKTALNRAESVEYLLVDPAGEHPPGEGLDGDYRPSLSLIGPSISHHTILFLTDEGGSRQTQVFSMPEEEKQHLITGREERVRL